MTHFFDKMEDSIFLDPEGELSVALSGHLPHWHQKGKIQYITFRLGDSLPLSRRRELSELRAQFFATHPEPWSDKEKLEYTNLIHPRIEHILNQGYGSCWLADTQIRSVMESVLHFYDGTDYELLAYVIMPNHVHVLMIPKGENSVSDIMRRLKGYSSILINKKLCHRGRLWQREYFDRLVRDEDHLKHCLSYIINNPRGLRPGVYSIYIAR